MAITNKIKTNPQLRKTYKAARTIAKKAIVGNKIMCPCGCLEQFVKEEKGQIFSLSHSRHESDYNKRVKSHQDNNDEEMEKILKVMNGYIQNYKLEQVYTQDDSIPDEKIKLSVIDLNPTETNIKNLMIQNYAISKHLKAGTETLCACGCNNVFRKLNKEQVFFNEKCEPHFNSLIEDDFEVNDDKKSSFKIMHLFVTRAIDILKLDPELKSKIDESEKRKKRIQKITGV